MAVVRMDRYCSVFSVWSFRARALRSAVLVLAALACVIAGGSPTEARNATPPAAKNTASAPTVGPAVGMVTGPKTGTYIAMGRDIARALKASGLVIDVKESGGSIDNIKRIGSSENAALGIVQSDVLGFLSRSTNPDSKRIAEALRMVFPLHREEVHLLARTSITRFSDLEGKRVVIGNEASGSLITAVNLLNLMGVQPAETLRISPPEGVVAVLQNQADAMIFVGGKPVKLFTNLERLKDADGGGKADLLAQVHFVSLDDPRMLAEYAPATLTPADYGFLAAPVPTLAVTAMLVSYDFSGEGSAYKQQRCQTLSRVGQALRRALPELKAKGHPKWKEVDPAAQIGVWKRDVCAWMDAPASATPAASPARASALQNDLLKIIEEERR